MASLKNAAKSRQKPHRERSQPESRAKLGFLEKKKDYKQRAEEFHRKESTLTALRRRALNRNPDEFYFNMVRTKKVDGVHQPREEREPEYTEEQIKLMRSQDIRYVNFKRTAELKKIERLKSELHLLDAQDKPQNKHTIFVDSKKDVKTFDAASHFNTHPALVGRRYNRPTWDTLEKHQTPVFDEEMMQDLASEKQKKYKELTKRIERERELSIIAQKMEVQKRLMDKKAKKKKIADETKESAAQYRWCAKRKR
ncbi:probable U3 small nucleolar RNA-associated protein 11 [Liolophura sinensis]|uniref:probable U3 small nucleolar RNA-associated protein 11 n=1 Tax=Liolophura sinensis TaxID=3198878 RepID=UPI0031580F4F